MLRDRRHPTPHAEPADPFEETIMTTAPVTPAAFSVDLLGTVLVLDDPDAPAADHGGLRA
jgi:hypothetical protein